MGHKFRGRAGETDDEHRHDPGGEGGEHHAATAGHPRILTKLAFFPSSSTTAGDGFPEGTSRS